MRYVTVRNGVLACLFVVAAVSIGCAMKPEDREAKVRDGKTYGVTRGTFRYRWWNYEERGRSFLDGGFYDDAIGDFKAAIRQRPKDTPRARTYGMHFVRYFPHRELGIAYLGKGDVENAVEQLKVSLAQAPSAKANYYLHDAVKAYLVKSGKDKSAPKLTLGDIPDIGAASLRFVLKGSVLDDYLVERVVINGMETDIPRGEDFVEFAGAVELDSGANAFKVEAFDVAGNVREEELSIVQDVTGPMVSLSTPRIGSVLAKRNVSLEGLVVDPAGVRQLDIAGQAFTLGGKPESDFKVAATMKPGRNLVRFRAVDETGNVTTGRLFFRYNESVSDSGEVHGKITQLAWIGDENFESGAVFGPKDGPQVDILNLRKDQIIPIIPKDMDQANGGSYVLQVMVAGEQPISAVSINDSAVDTPELPNLFFTRRVPLEEGEAVIKVQAKDKNGKDTIEEVRIKAEVPKMFDTENRLCLAPMPFLNKMEEAQSTVNFLRFESYTRKAFGDIGRFRLVERKDDVFEKIIAEQKLSESLMIDKGKALASGKLLNAECMLVGAIIEDANGAEVLSRIIDVETGEIVAEPQVYGTTKTKEDVRKLSMDLADAVIQSVPLVSGTIDKVKNADTVVIDKGGNAGLVNGSEVLLFRIEVDPDLEEEMPVEIALGEVTKAGSKKAIVKVTDMLAGDGVKPLAAGDEFVTR